MQAVMDERPRAQRSDAGNVEATARDAAALRWIAEQFAVRDDVLAVILGRLGAPDTRRQALDRVGLPTARQTVRRWVRAGWAERRRALDGSWTLPTAAGYRLAGIEPKSGPEVPPGVLVMEPWTLRLRMLPHVHAVGIVRLALERGLEPGQRWVSEREMRRESSEAARDRGGGRVRILRHIFDGAIEGAAGERIGVDVELSLKSPVLFAETIARPPLQGVTAAVYFAPPRLLSTLRERLKEMRSAVPTTIESLPDLGIAYMED